MNEELLKKIYEQKGFSQFGPYEQFRSDMLSSPDMRKKVWEQKGFKEFGDLAKFENDLGVAPSNGIQPLPTYQKGPVGVARPGVMANPGITDEKLQPFYKVDMDKVTSASLTGGPAHESIQPNPTVMKEFEKEANIDRENKAAELLNRQGDVLSVAKDIYGTDFNKKKEKYSKDPQIADAEFSFEALAQYRDNAQYVSSRSRDRLKLLFKDKYSPDQVDKLVNTYTAMTLMGNTAGANKLVAEHPDLLTNANTNNIFIANEKLRDAAMSEMHVIKNNPRWYERQQKIAEKQKQIDESVSDYRDQEGVAEVAQRIFLPGTNEVFHPNVGQVLKAKLGTWTKNIAMTPGLRDWARDMMDFNPKSSDYQGRSIEKYKEATIGKNKYDVVFDQNSHDKVDYIRDANTGFIIRPDDEQRKAIEDAAAKGEMKSRFNTKPFVGQTADVIVDMLPIIAITAATQGALTAFGGSAAIGADIGVIGGSALQMRGDILDQMLKHPDISNAEAELYTAAIGTGIGLISMINPIEKNILSKSIPGIAKSNVNKVLNGTLTKGQLAWAITKDVAKVITKEPAEEIAQDWFQYWATKKIDDNKKGIGNFLDNPAPSTDQMIETALVSAAVGLLGGAGSIRRSRSAFTDSALETALNNPKLVDKYLADMKTGTEGITDPEKKKEAEDHLSRLNDRWENLKANTKTLKGMKGDVRGQLATLLVDSNQLETELNGVTNEAIKADKKSEINDINKQIKDLINPPKPEVKPAATETPETATPDENQDIDRAAADNINLIADQGAELNVDYFDHGQKVEDEHGKGTITDVHKNQDGTTHSIEIEYADESIPKRTVIVAQKSPKEIGVKIIQGEKGAVKPPSTPETPTPKTDTEGQTKASIPVMITKKMESDLRDQGLSQEQIDKLTPQEAHDILNKKEPQETPAPKTPSELDAEHNPEIKKEIDTENVRLEKERQSALTDLADLVSVDPNLDAESIRNKIENDYTEGVKQINVSARKNYLNKKRDADIKKAKEVGKRRGIDVVALGTIDRINQAYDDKIAAVEKDYGVADELKTEGAAKKEVVKSDIEAQRDEQTFPRKDYESNPHFQTIQKNYQKSKGKTYGKSVSRTLPSGEKVAGKYVLVNKNDIAASHLPKSFAKTPGVPVTPNGTTFNDNDYETSRSAQATQTRIARNFDERAIDDIVFIDSNGIVKSGNGRTISRQMSSAEHSKAYLDALKSRAKEFGFTKAQIEAIGDENVILAVELEGQPVYNTKEYSKFNAASEKQKSPLQKAIAIAKSIGEKTIALIANVFDQADVMSDLTPKDVQHIKEILLKAGIITELDQSQYFDENAKLTAAGSEFVENILLSSVFNEDELRMLANMPKLRKKLSVNRVRLIKNSQKGRLSLIPKIRQAIYLINDAKKFEGTFENRLLQQITQGSLFNVAGEIDAETVNIALILNDAEMLRTALNKLNEAEDAADLFGNTTSTDDVVNFTLETLKADLNDDAKKILEIAAAIPRTEAKNIAPAAPISNIGSNEQANVESGTEVKSSTSGKKTKAKPVTNDQENQSGVPGEKQQGQEPIQTQPIEGVSTKETSPSGIFQTPEQNQEEHVVDYQERKPLDKVWEIVNDKLIPDEEKVNLITEFITPYIQGLSPELRDYIGQIGDNPATTVEEIASEYANAEVYGVVNQTGLIDYVREVIRENYFDEYLPSIDGHFPNANGVYDEANAEGFVYPRKVKGWQGLPEADIHVMQLADKTWIVSRGFHNHTGDHYGSTYPLSFYGERYDTREEAIVDAAQDIITGHRDQAVRNWAHDIIDAVGGQQPELPPIENAFFIPTNVEPPTTESQPAKQKAKSKKSEKISEIDKEIDDIWNYFKKLGIAVTPEQQIQDQKMALRLINLYIQKGYYRIREIMEDMLTKMDKADAERILPHVKKGYLSAQVDLPDDVVEKMDDRDMVRAMQVEDIHLPTKEENIAPNDTQEEKTTTPTEEETISESEPRDTESIIADSETALSQAELAATPEEIRKSLNALENAIEEATSKLGQLVTSYQIEGIAHETPNVVIAKQAKKDITKHANEIARLTGWTAKHIYANIPPAGGEVGMTFEIPNTNLSVHAWIKYDPQDVSPYDDYLFSGMMYRLERVEAGGRVKSVTTNRQETDNMSAKEVALTFFKAAKPYLEKELTAPVEIPTAIQKARDLGPLFAAKPTENSPIFGGKSGINVKPESGKRTRNSGRKLDQSHQGFQQGLLFGAEPEGDIATGSTEEGTGVRSGGGKVEGNGEISTGGRGGSSENVSVSGTLSVEDPRKDEAAAQPAHNFHFPNNYTEPTNFNQPQRFRDNLNALQTLIQLLKSNRDALPDEQEALSKYVGWGGIKVILNNENTQWTEADERMRPMVAELKTMIDVLEKELGLKNVLRGIKGSVLNAHYTSIPIIRSMYSILYRMGFNGGTILEPSAGIGNFLGAMPGLMAQHSKLHAIELEQLTGHILKKLYPKAMTTVGGYETMHYPSNNFDLIVSNVPFGNYRVYTDPNASPILKKAGAAIHNYFFVRALDQVKEGGLISFITTSATLDTKGNQFIREHLNQNADFLGAIRLPSTAFQGNAGTQVVTDIIFLRKNTTGVKTNPDFLNLHPLQVQHKNNGKDITIQVNEYFVNNPDHVIGEFKAGGLYAEDEMTVVAPRSLNVADEILKLESKFPTDAFNPQNSDHSPEKEEHTEDLEFVPDFRYYVRPDGSAAINKDGEPMIVPKTHSPKIPAFIKLRETLRRQYDLELYSDSETAIEANRKELQRQYDDFVKKNGFLNSQKNKPFISRDDFGFNVLSLEIWNKENNTAKKSDILNKRSLNRIRKAESAASFEDAVAISVNETAKVDLHRIAELMGLQPDQVFEQAYGLFFKDTDGNIVERSEYLSGNVKQKLALAKEMADVDPLFAKNVEELEKVIPEDIPYTLIDVNLGSRWIPTNYYEDFLKHVLGTSNVSVTYSRAADLYKVDGERNVESTTKFGTGRMTAYELMVSAMQGRAPVVKDLVDPGPPKKYVVNQAETQAARDKLVDLVNAFEDWIFSDHDRAKKLEKSYNELFNTNVKRSFDGTNFHVDGLKDITLMEHQKTAASMVFLNNGGIVDHIVGAGKTYTMISAAMKMKQTGVATKPTIMALKSTIPQIVADAKKVFPSARILAPTEADFKSKNRKALLARIQNNDWDLVIMSHEQFKFIPQDPDFEAKLINEEIEAIEKEVEAMIEESGKENKRMRTALENRIKSLVERLEKVQNKGKKDTELLTFKEIGIDHLFVDESQQFKNLPYATKISNVAGLGNPKGSSRAFNLLTAVRTLQALHGGDKGTTFLSGTPISNSLVEMYLLLKYLRPTRMKELGYDTFDSWSKNAAKQTDELEFSVTGTIKSKTRFRTFVNIPEVVGLYTEIADVRNENNLTLPRPTIKGGEPTLVTVPQNDEQEEMTARLIEFAGQKHGERDGALIGKPGLTEKQQTAAMLLVTNLSTKLSVDMRLIDPKASFNPDGKLAAVANHVYDEYVKSEGIKGTQLVFCDVGTPKSGKIKEDLRDYLQDERGVIDDDLNVIFGDPENPKKQTLDDIRQALIDHLEYTEEEADEAIDEARSFSPFNAYDEVKRLLVEKGIPENEVVFIHSYKNENAKKKLFDDVNDGKIRVVLGSTQKLGTGVNVQRRAVAAHHIDASWNPASMTQRNGRVIRQGNMNAEVSIYNYGTELTLDAYKYQLIYTKQKFIDQVKTGASGERTYKEGEGEDMSSQKIVALLSGNPLLLDKEKADSQVEKLKRAKRAYDSEQYQIKSKISETKEGITRLTAAIANREDDLKTVKDNSTIVSEEIHETVDSLEYNDFDHLKADPRISNIEVKMVAFKNSKETRPTLVYTKSRMEPNVEIRGKVPKDSEERNKWMDAISIELKKKYGMSLGGEEVIGKAGGLDIIGRVKLEKGEYDKAAQANRQSLVVNYFLRGQYEYPTSPSTFSPAVNKIEPDLVKAKDALQERKDNLVKLQELDGKPWPKQSEYDAALAKQKEIDLQLRAQEAAKSNEPPANQEFSEDDEINFSMQDVTDDNKLVSDFYSPLYETISTAKAEKMPVKHWIEKFASSEEARWTGLQSWLVKQTGSITKDEVIEFLNENQIKIEEVVKAENKDPFSGKSRQELMEDIRNEIRSKGYDLEMEMGGDWMLMKNDEMVEEEDYDSVPEDVRMLAEQHYDIEQNNQTPEEGNTQYQGYTLNGEKSNYREILVTLPNNPATALDFRSQHWMGEKNILLHLRTDMRVDENGDPVLFIEEMQSDWAQTGRKRGFVNREDQWAFDFAEQVYNIKRLYNREVYTKDEANIKLAQVKDEARSNGIPENMIEEALAKYGDFTVSRPSGQPVAPFVTDTNAWTKLGLKVALKHAVNLGATKIAWTTGDQQNDRYDLSDQVASVSASASKTAGLYNLVIEDKSGQELNQYRGSGKSVTPDEMRETIGDELANRLMAGADERKGTPWINKKKENPEFYTIKGLDLKVGGAGMQGYYGNPETNNLGIIGNVAKSMFGYVSTTKIDTGENPTTQHSVTITPAIRSMVVKKGIPMFSMAAYNDAQEAVKSENPNPNGPIIINLVNQEASPNERLQQYAGVWLDEVQKVNPAFVKRGLELIKGTDYDNEAGAKGLNSRTALINAIADHAEKLPKTHKLISWVKQFWQKVGKVLRLNIDPEKLRELTIQQYLDIAATQLRYGTDIYAELVADGAQVTDSAQAQIPSPETTKKPLEERQTAIEKELNDQVEAMPKPQPKPVVKPRIEPEIPVDKEFEFDSRDLNATGTVFTNPKSPEAERLLRDYSGAKKRLIETVYLLFPTLKNAGITLTLHESPDSYYNAVTANGGSKYQAVSSGGFYKAKQIHINLSKPDLKENTALHEAFHPIIREILVNDRVTFQRFLKDILADPEMKKRYHDNFAQRYAGFPADTIAEEILVEASADTVMKRILENMKDLPDNLFDRIITYIKKALGDTYGQLVQFVNTKESFASFANTMADSISRGMAVTLNPDIEGEIRTIVNDSIQLSKGGLMAPNGRPSNLSPAQWQQVRTPEFKAWFGDWENDPANASKVVDENGEPLAVYHGTSNTFDTFDRRYQSSGIYGDGFYFAYDIRDVPNKNKILSVFVKSLHPLQTGTAEYFKFVDDHNLTTTGGVVGTQKISGIAEKNGYDSVISSYGYGNQVAVFKPNQIKSATDNVGTFSQGNPNIRFSMSDNTVSLLPQVYSQKGLVNNEKVKRISKRIIEGTARIERLNSAEEQGRITGGKRNVELSILLGASQRANSNAQSTVPQSGSVENNRQIQLIKDYANQEGFLVPLSKIESEFEFIDSGAEADVYIDNIADHVLKVVKINPFGIESPLAFIDNKISLYNYLFPDTKVELVGIAHDNKYIHFMLRQPFVQSSGNWSYNELERQMEKYFKAETNINTESPETEYKNADYLIGDLHEKNVIRSAGGILHVIDAEVKLNTKKEGYGGSRTYSDFDIVEDAQPQFSMQSEEDRRKEEIKANLQHKILTNPDVNFEPIADNLVKKGIMTKAEADDILHGWRQSRVRNLSQDKAIAAIENMAEFLHLRRMDEADNLQVNNATMQQFIEDFDKGMEDLLDRYSAYNLKKLVEEVAGSGLAYPPVVLEELHRLNDQRNPTAAGPKLTIAISIAFAELEKARKAYAKIVEQTGSIDASEQLQHIEEVTYRLANAAKVNGSIAGASLGIRSKLLQLAGLTYQSQLAQIEILNKSKAGKNITIDDADKKELNRLVNVINGYQEAMDKAILAANPAKNKQIAAQNAFNAKMRSPLEARATLTKQEALELLRRMRAVRASFSLALSLDEPEYTYFDLINELVKIAHAEGAKGFKEVVNKVMGYDSTIKEDEIYNAILSTTPHAQQKARSEYAKRQAITRKHVKDINNVETMLTKQVTDLLRRQRMPEEKDINEFGDLLKEIEKNIYQLDASNELVVQWANALDAIRTNYSLAFLNPVPNESTDIFLSKIINAVRILKDQKFHQWLESKNKELDEQLAKINAGRVSELIEDDDITHRSLPSEMVVPEYNEDGEIIGDKIVPYNFGAMDRLIRDKKREIERIKDKYRKGSAKDKLKLWYRTLRGTLGSAMAMADLSYFAIQGFRMFATFGLRNPRLFGRAFKDSIRTMIDEFRRNPGLSNEIYRQITENPFYERAVALGLVITSPDSHIFVNEMLGEEDLFDMAYESAKGRRNYAAKSAKLVFGARKRIKMASNAAFATHLNLLSMTTFASYIQRVRETTGEDPTNQELTVLAREINNSTGRTTRLADSTKTWGQVFWAPKLYLSQIINIGNIVGDPANFLYHLSQGNKDMARVYGQRTINSVLFAAVTAGLYMLRVLIAKAQCGEHASVNTDASKPSFLKIKCGELTLDPTGNHRQWIAIGGRIIAAWDGEPYTDFTGQPVGTWDQIQQLMQYKLNPLLSLGIQFTEATDFLGRPRIPDDQSALKWKSRVATVLDHIVPMSGGNIVGVAKAKNVAPISKPGTMAEALLGFGVNYIDAEKEAKRAKIEKEVKARKKQEDNTEAVRDIQKKYGALEELQGKFESVIPAESLQPTTKHYRDRSGKYRVFLRTDDPDRNGKADDFYIVKIRKSGENKGKKFLYSPPDKERIK